MLNDEMKIILLLEFTLRKLNEHFTFICITFIGVLCNGV